MVSKAMLDYYAREGPYISELSPLEATFGKRSSADLSSHEDFRKHRTRLNKALFRIRRDLHLITRDTKHYSENEKTSSISPQMYDDDPRHGWLLLLIAERDAVHALEIKSLLEASRGRQSPYRRLMVSKLKKAVATCHKLVAVVKNEWNELAKLQFYVYGALISGAYAVAKKHWAQAIDAFCIARCGLDTLFGWAPRNQRDFMRRINGWWSYDADLRNLYCVTGVTGRCLTQVLVEELTSKSVDPSLRLALSQSSPHESSTYLKTFSRRRARDSPVPWLAPAVGIMRTLHPGRFEDIPKESISRDIKWRTHEAHIYNDELAQKLYELQKNPGDQYSIFSMVPQWSTLVDIHNSDLARSEDMDDAEKVRDGAIVLTYLKYHMLFSRVSRDLVLLSRSRPESGDVRNVLWANERISKLLSSMIGTIQELSELPGVYDDELSQGLEQMTRVLGAEKYMPIAQAYAVVGKFSEALKLLSHAEEQVSGLKGGSAVEAFPYGVGEIVQQFKTRVRQQLTAVHIMAELQSRESRRSRLVTDDIHQVPYFDGLHRMTDVDQHAKIRPVLCKAVLFDVAYNYIGYSDAVEGGTTAASAGEQGLQKRAFRRGATV